MTKTVEKTAVTEKKRSGPCRELWIENTETGAIVGTESFPSVRHAKLYLAKAGNAGSFRVIEVAWQGKVKAETVTRATLE